jgi:glycosidase
MKGVPFVYNGTEEAFPTAIVFPFTSVTINWGINPGVTAFYKQVIAFRDSSVAIRRGTLAAYDNNDVCAFTKTAGDSSVLVLVNLRNTTVNYPVPVALQNSAWTDVFAGGAVSVGSTVSLAPYQYMVLRN